MAAVSASALALAAIRAQRSAKVDPKAFVERYADDFLGFATLLEIVPKDGKLARFKPWPSQRAFDAARTGRDVVLKARQIGFTTFEQARDVWAFLVKPGARVVATCQSTTEHAPAKNLSSNYRCFFDSLRKLGVELPFRTESATEWELLGNGSRLRIEEAGASEAAAAKKGRSGTVTRLHLTETAFYEYADDTLNALLECVPPRELGRSEIVSESTPNGASGRFFEQCEQARAGSTGYRFHFLPWFTHPEYSVEVPEGEVVEPRTEREHQLVKLGVTLGQLLWYRRKVAEKGQRLVDQEYPSDPDSCFLVSGRQFFDPERTEALIRAARPPVETIQVRGNGAHGELRIWHKPESGRSYVLALDVAEGDGGDRGAGYVIERGTGRHMATLHGQFKPWELARAGAGVGARYNGAEIAVERNNHGHACLRALDVEQGYSPIWRDRDDKPGWNNNQVSRTAALDSLEEVHRNGTWVTHDVQVAREMRTFVVGPTGKAEAASGCFDDLVMAATIAWDVASRPETARGVGTEPVFPF